ncbi:glycosyltransferase family 2 protein [Marinobacter nauticus]|uniref:glycosyltransferase family 2 protein n=1 Tax=Marinobacter nauticus TaxID=2743 RepID=UPI003734FA18
MLPIAVVIATRPRPNLLIRHALPAVEAQQRKPDVIVVVSDERPFSAVEQDMLRRLTPSVKVVFGQNQHSTGAAGTWNTGFSILNQLYKDCYVAIIDDDDHWHADHLGSCEATSRNGQADVVLSGINVVQDNVILARNIPENISANDFLTGNPGWQGSNTFIRLSTALRIGGYTDGLISCNDRDFAIRALELGDLDIQYTRRVTVDWHINQSPDALSAVGSEQKLKGSAQFLKLHGGKMSPVQRKQFFSRMESLFGLTKSTIEQTVQGM